MFSSPLKDAVIVLIIVLLFFGPKRLPALSRAIGESVKEFKGGIGNGATDEDAKPEIQAAPVAASQPVVPEAEAASPTVTSSENINA
ncbi:MAG: Sec-independent protein translocase subunit TatA/TatB [Solirubrobacteraceae bacterium]